MVTQTQHTSNKITRRSVCLSLKNDTKCLPKEERELFIEHIYRPICCWNQNISYAFVRVVYMDWPFHQHNFFFVYPSMHITNTHRQKIRQSYYFINYEPTSLHYNLWLAIARERTSAFVYYCLELFMDGGGDARGLHEISVQVRRNGAPSFCSECLCLRLI